MHSKYAIYGIYIIHTRYSIQSKYIINIINIINIEYIISIMNVIFNSGSTIQGDHILAFWQTEKVDPLQTRTLGTHSTAFRATCTRYFNNFMAHYL